jgi:hypothetical protein
MKQISWNDHQLKQFVINIQRKLKSTREVAEVETFLSVSLHSAICATGFN